MAHIPSILMGIYFKSSFVWNQRSGPRAGASDQNQSSFRQNIQQWKWVHVLMSTSAQFILISFSLAPPLNMLQKPCSVCHFLHFLFSYSVSYTDWLNYVKVKLLPGGKWAAQGFSLHHVEKFAIFGYWKLKETITRERIKAVDSVW